jgi:sarcosine oxidase
MNAGRTFDTVVAGLGAMGSAALFHLAKRGAKVLGIDPYAPPHTFGSSHGETRVIREAYFEHSAYVPLVQRAYELWEELERLSYEKLYLKTGGIMLGTPESTVIAGTLRSASEHQLLHEVLNSNQIQERIPGLQPARDMIGVLESRAGILYPEKCVAAHLQLAGRNGAVIHSHEMLSEWKHEEDGVLVRTNRETYHAKKLILAAGSWIRSLLGEYRLLFQVERQVLLWFQAKNRELFDPDVFPIHLWEYEPEKMFYGFPDLGSGTKVAFHHQGEITSPATVDRNVRSEDVSAMREVLERFLPAANGEFLRGTVCLYTNTPDGHFIIDTLPEQPNVLIASPCSGHGFKFASAIGEVLADLTEGKVLFDLEPYSLKRFPRSTAV